MSDEQGPFVAESADAFARRVGLTFGNMYYLVRALTHRSYANEHSEVVEDNERLEFLGDAVLDFLVGSYLYDHMPEMSEGRLTKLRAALVRNEQLAEFARQIDLGRALRLGKGEAENGGRDRYTVLGSAFEALVGAIYLDQEMDGVKRFMEPMFIETIEQIMAKNSDEDPKSLLQEYTQSHGMGTPFYETVGVEGPDHDRLYTVVVKVGEGDLGTGSGRSKQAATKSAAQDALNHLQDKSA